MSIRPKVLHVVDTFLSRSETFIYNVVSNHVDFSAAVLCYACKHEDEFPFSPRNVVPTPVSKRDPHWWLDPAAERLTGRSIWHRAAEAVVRREAPAIMHAHFAQQGYKVLPIKRRLGIPLVTSFYGYDMSALPNRPGWRERLAQLFVHGDAFLVEGAHMREKVIALGAPAAKVHLQRIMIRVDKYPAWQPPTGDKVVLFVGRFVDKKGLPDAIHAVAKVVHRGQRIAFRIIGDGEGRREAEQLIAACGLLPHTTFLGMRAHDEVVAALAHAHVLLHPSRTGQNGDSEGGAPTILLEAQAVGVPVVSTRHADIPNVVGTGAIYLSDERDVAALAENLEAALTSGRPANSAFVRAHHDVPGQIRSLENYYRAAIA